MTLDFLERQIRKKKSFLCIGLDTDLSKIPKHLLSTEDPIFEFNKAIVKATHDLCVAYKPNIAFYEAYGSSGWISLEKTMNWINQEYPNHFTIADAKRGDIGNTADRYAQAFFKELNFDSVTVAPYMGRDSIEPFLNYPEKYCVLLALTSNPGAYDFQTQELFEGHQVFEHILKKSITYHNAQKLMFVVGATKTEALQQIRAIIPDNFLLIPGIGAQGGNLEEVCRGAINNHVGILVNASRSILYASKDSDFDEAARIEAAKLQLQMESYL